MFIVLPRVGRMFLKYNSAVRTSGSIPTQIIVINGGILHVMRCFSPHNAIRRRASRRRIRGRRVRIRSRVVLCPKYLNDRYWYLIILLWSSLRCDHRHRRRANLATGRKSGGNIGDVALEKWRWHRCCRVGCTGGAWWGPFAQQGSRRVRHHQIEAANFMSWYELVQGSCHSLVSIFFNGLKLLFPWHYRWRNPPLDFHIFLYPWNIITLSLRNPDDTGIFPDALDQTTEIWPNWTIF